MKKTLVLVACLSGGLLIASVASSSEKDRARSTLYEVPTSGRIVDVSYMPVYEEWWVKAQEKDGFSIYTYDMKSKKWHRAKFVAVPPPSADTEAKEAAPPKSTAPNAGEKPSALEPREGVPPGAHDATEQVDKGAGEGKQAPEKKARDEKKWWDIRKLLQPDAPKSHEKTNPSTLGR